MSCLKTLGSAKVHMYQQIKKDSWLSAEKPRQTHKAGTQIQIWKRESCDSDSNIFECSWMHFNSGCTTQNIQLVAENFAAHFW